MRVNFGEIINEVLTQMGKTQDSAETTLLDSIKLRINQIQSKIYYHDTWEWRRNRYYFSTLAPLSAGTITLTKGSRQVTGSGTAFTDLCKYGYLLKDGKLYKVDPHTAITTTSLSLAAPYSGETASGTAYQVVFPEYLLDPEVAGVVNAYVNDEEIAVKSSDRLIISDSSTGEPDEMAIVGRTDFTYYETGTVSVTNGSSTVTGSGTTFDSTMVGMPFKIDENAELYTVHSVTNATTLVLRQVYNGDTGSGKTYKIAPKGSPLVRLLSVPDDVHFVEIDAVVSPRKLYNDTDESAIPNHNALIHGATWLALRDLENKAVSQIQQAERVYRDSLKELKDMYKTIKNIKWTSENELLARQVGNKGHFDPLNTRVRN